MGLEGIKESQRKNKKYWVNSLNCVIDRNKTRSIALNDEKSVTLNFNTVSIRSVREKAAGNKEVNWK